MPRDLQIDMRPQAGDMIRLAALGERYQRMTGKAAFDALKWMGWRLSGALAASTPSAKKKRKLRENPDHDPAFGAASYPKFVYYYVGEARRRHFVKAGEEGADPWLTISRAGLAKKSWRWMVGKLGRSGGNTAGIRPSMVEVWEFKDWFNPGVELTNKLGYMDTILKRSGKQSVDTAFARAVRAGEHRMERFIAGKLKYL